MCIKILILRAGFPWTPFQCLTGGRDVCGFPTGMRRPDPCTTHSTPHMLHYAWYTLYRIHDTPQIIYRTLYTTHRYAIFSMQYTSIQRVVVLRREGGIAAARWSRNWFCPAAQGQIPRTTQSNLLHYRNKSDTLQRQICFTTESNLLHYRDKYTRETTVPGTQYYIGWGPKEIKLDAAFHSAV